MNDFKQQHQQGSKHVTDSVGKMGEIKINFPEMEEVKFVGMLAAFQSRFEGENVVYDHLIYMGYMLDYPVTMLSIVTRHERVGEQMETDFWIQSFDGAKPDFIENIKTMVDEHGKPEVFPVLIEQAKTNLMAVAQ